MLWGLWRNLIQDLENRSWTQNWLKLAPSGICLWVGNAECFENWMGLSSFKIPSWLKENNIHCLKTPLFVFSPFPILRSRNLQKHSVFASCSPPKTFLETKWSRNLWVVLLQTSRTNRGTSLLMFRLSYLRGDVSVCHHRQIELLKVGALEMRLSSCSPSSEI